MKRNLWAEFVGEEKGKIYETKKPKKEILRMKFPKGGRTVITLKIISTSKTS